VHFLKKLTIFK